MARVNYAIAALLGLLLGESYLLLASIRFDFATYYRAAAALSLGANPYVDFNYRQMPLWAWLLQPVARLPFHWASALWLTMSLAGLVAAVLLAFSAFGWSLDRRRLALLLAFIASPPALICLFFGQATPFVLLGCCLALALHSQQRSFLAGLAFSLAMIKPHLALVLAPFLLAMPLRAWLGFAAGASVWFGLSAAISLDLLGDFLSRIFILGTNPQLEERPTLFGLGGAYLPHATLLNLLLAAAIVLMFLWLLVARLRSRPLPIAPDVATIAAILLLPYVLINDLILLMPVFFLIATSAPRSWLLLTVGLIWTLPFLTMYLGAQGLLVSLDGLILFAMLLARQRCKLLPRLLVKPST